MSHYIKILTSPCRVTIHEDVSGKLLQCSEMGTGVYDGAFEYKGKPINSIIVFSTHYHTHLCAAYGELKRFIPGNSGKLLSIEATRPEITDGAKLLFCTDDHVMMMLSSGDLTNISGMSTIGLPRT